jgi:hypothetical protein
MWWRDFFKLWSYPGPYPVKDPLAEYQAKKAKQDVPVEERWHAGCDICGCKDMERPSTIHSSTPGVTPMDVCLMVCSHHTDQEVGEAIRELYRKRRDRILADSDHPWHQRVLEREEKLKKLRDE